MLTALPALPARLEYLNCDNNNIGSLPPLNIGLRELSCVNTELTSLPTLPQTLISLKCIGNHLTELPKLPPNLRELIINHNNISIIPELPDSLTSISLHSNPLQEPFLTCYNDYRLSGDINEFKRNINALYAGQRASKKAGRNLMTAKLTLSHYPGNLQSHIGSILSGQTGTLTQQRVKLEESASRIPGADSVSRKRKSKSRKSKSRKSKSRKSKSRKFRSNRL